MYMCVQCHVMYALLPMTWEEMSCHVLYDLALELARRKMMKCRARYTYYYLVEIARLVCNTKQSRSKRRFFLEIHRPTLGIHIHIFLLRARSRYTQLRVHMTLMGSVINPKGLLAQWVMSSSSSSFYIKWSPHLSLIAADESHLVLQLSHLRIKSTMQERRPWSHSR